MRNASFEALARLPVGGLGGALFVVVLLGLAGPGCARDRHEITPTTLGTDLSRSPKGRMIPFPWPGQDIVKRASRPGSPTADPDAALASGERPPG